VLPLVRWVVVLLLTLSLQKDDSEAVDNTSGLGCAFRFLFRFHPGLIFRNPHFSADYFRLRGTHIEMKSFQGKINLFWNPPEPGIRLESGGKDP
jgi:hypothetical protein